MIALRKWVLFANQLVAERDQQMQPVVVLGQAAITNFAVAEDLLDIPERMLNLGTNTCFDFLGFQLVRTLRLAGAWSFGNEPGDILAVLMLIQLLNAR